MSSVVIAGDVSGSVTLQAPSAAGSTVLTLPATSGTVQVSGAAGSFSSLSDSGNLAFTGTSNRITGDFSNATLANRVAFQTSTVNGITNIEVIPNGTSTQSGLKLETDSAIANGSNLTFDVIGGSVSQISSGVRGTGTYLPMTFSTGSSERVRIDTSGNVGIGTSSPGYLLSVSKNGGGGDSGQLARFTDTSTSNSVGPFHLTMGATNHFASNPSPVIAGTNGLGFAVGDGSDLANQRKMMIDSSGNVGIGTSSPAAKLDVNGSLKVSGGNDFTATGNVYLGSSSGAYSTFIQSAVNWNYSNLNLIRHASNTANPRFFGMLLDGDSTTSTTIGGYNAIWGAYDSAPTTGSTSSALNGAMVYGAFAGHRWVTNGSERMRIDSSGNVGIGTSSPTEKLQIYSTSINPLGVYGNITSTPASLDAGQLISIGLNAPLSGTTFSAGDARLITMGVASSTAYPYIRATGLQYNVDNNHLFYTAGTERMRITAAGNVGIGTANPTIPLVINKYVSSGGQNYSFQTSDTINTTFSIAHQSGPLCNLITDGNLCLYAANYETMRITNNGGTANKVYVQTTTQFTPGGVGGVMSIKNPKDDGEWALGLENAATTGTRGRGLGIHNVTDFNTGSSEFIYCNGGSTARWYVLSNGSTYNSTGVYAAISDIKFKQDVVDANSQWEDIKAFKIRKFRMKDEVEANADAPYKLGFIAQELEETNPGLIDEYTNPDGESWKTVKMSIVYMKAVKALQEAIIRIEQLEAEVSALQGAK